MSLEGGAEDRLALGEQAGRRLAVVDGGGGEQAEAGTVVLVVAPMAARWFWRRSFSISTVSGPRLGLGPRGWEKAAWVAASRSRRRAVSAEVYSPSRRSRAPRLAEPLGRIRPPQDGPLMLRRERQTGSLPA